MSRNERTRMSCCASFPIGLWCQLRVCARTTPTAMSICSSSAFRVFSSSSDAPMFWRNASSNVSRNSWSETLLNFRLWLFRSFEESSEPVVRVVPATSLLVVVEGCSMVERTGCTKEHHILLVPVIGGSLHRVLRKQPHQALLCQGPSKECALLLIPLTKHVVCHTLHCGGFEH